MTTYLNNSINNFQDNLYSNLNDYSKEHGIRGRLKGAFIVVPLDVLAETSRAPLLVIEHLAKIPIHLFGAAFNSEDYSVKCAIKHAENAIGSGLHIPVSLAIAPIKIIFQEIAMLAKPEKVNSIAIKNPTFGSNVSSFLKTTSMDETLFDFEDETLSIFEEEVLADLEEETLPEETLKFNTYKSSLEYKIDSLYGNFNTYSQKHGILGRFYAVPVSIIDVAAETLSMPLSAIENLGDALFHFTAAGFSKNHTLKSALTSAERAVSALMRTPLSIGMAPIKIIFQVGASLIDPSRVKPFYRADTFIFKENRSRLDKLLNFSQKNYSGKTAYSFH